MTEAAIDYILPPFPFPSMWKDVHNWQQSLGQKFWLVPDQFLIPPVMIQPFESGNRTDF